MAKRLIAELDTYVANSFTDLLMLYAHDIEQALILSGAKAGKDYDYRMLMELAQPYVLARQEKRYIDDGKALSLTVEI